MICRDLQRWILNHFIWVLSENNFKEPGKEKIILKAETVPILQKEIDENGANPD